MNNQHHDELTDIIQAELTQLASVVQPSFKVVTRKIRRFAIICFAFAILFSVLLAWDMQAIFFITQADAINIAIIVVCITLQVILGIIFLLLGSQKFLIKHSTKKIIHNIENHISTPITLNTTSPDRIILKFKHHKYYFKPAELHITNTQVDQYNLIWAPSYQKRFKNRLRTPLIAYCTEERLEQLKQAFSPAVKVVDDWPD